VSFDEFRQVSWVVDELLGFIVNNVGSDVIEESRVVGHNETSHILLCFEPIFKPSNRASVELWKSSTIRKIDV
jgi:hypothetical protein